MISHKMWGRLRWGATIIGLVAIVAAITFLVLAWCGAATEWGALGALIFAYLAFGFAGFSNRRHSATKPASLAKKACGNSIPVDTLLRGKINVGGLSSLIITARCSDCQHCQQQYLTTLQGQGVFRFSYCSRSITEPFIVEPDIGRYCEHFLRREDAETGNSTPEDKV
jgi:hypothetical protein